MDMIQNKENVRTLNNPINSSLPKILLIWFWRIDNDDEILNIHNNISLIPEGSDPVFSRRLHPDWINLRPDPQPWDTKLSDLDLYTCLYSVIIDSARRGWIRILFSGDLYPDWDNIRPDPQPWDTKLSALDSHTCLYNVISFFPEWVGSWSGFFMDPDWVNLRSVTLSHKAFGSWLVCMPS